VMWPAAAAAAAAIVEASNTSNFIFVRNGVKSGKEGGVGPVASDWLAGWGRVPFGMKMREKGENIQGCQMK
jgi:hypothetical protein